MEVSGRSLTTLAGQVKDVASGCQTILEMIEFDQLQEICGEQRLMSNDATCNLTRLAIQSLRMLNQQADDSLTWAFKYCTDEGKAQRASMAKLHIERG